MIQPMTDFKGFGPKCTCKLDTSHSSYRVIHHRMDNIRISVSQASWTRWIHSIMRKCVLQTSVIKKCIHNAKAIQHTAPGALVGVYPRSMAYSSEIFSLLLMLFLHRTWTIIYSKGGKLNSNSRPVCKWKQNFQLFNSKLA